MMEFQTQSQEHWNRADDTVLRTQVDTISEACNGNKSMERVPDGSIAHADNKEIVSSILEMPVTADKEFSDAFPTSKKDGIENRARSTKALDGFSCSAVNQDSSNVPEAEGSKESDQSIKTDTNPNKTLPSGEDVHQISNVAHSKQDMETWEQNCSDMPFTEVIEVKSEARREEAVASNVLEVMVPVCGGEETILPVSKSVEVEMATTNAAVDVEVHCCGSKQVESVDIEQMNTHLMKEEAREFVTASQDTKQQFSGDASGIVIPQVDRVESAPVENNVDIEEPNNIRSEGINEYKTAIREERSSVSMGDQNCVSNTEKDKNTTDQLSEESICHIIHNTEIKQKKSSGDADRIYNIFEKFCSSGDFQVEATVSSDNEDGSYSENNNIICNDERGQTLLFQPRLDHGENLKGDPQKPIRQVKNEAFSCSLQKDLELEQTVVNVVVEDGLELKSDQASTNCTKIDMKENSNTLHKDMHGNTVTDMTQISDGVLQQCGQNNQENYQKKLTETNKNSIDVKSNEDTEGFDENNTERLHISAYLPHITLTKVKTIHVKSDKNSHNHGEDSCLRGGSLSGEEDVCSHAQQSKEAGCTFELDIPPQSVFKTDSYSVRDSEVMDLDKVEKDYLEENSKQRKQKADMQIQFENISWAMNIDTDENNDQGKCDGDVENDDGRKGTACLHEQHVDNNKEHEDIDEKNSEAEGGHHDGDSEDSDVKKENNRSAVEKLSEDDDDPETPQFQLARTKMTKTYSRKSESDPSLETTSTRVFTTNSNIAIADLEEKSSHNSDDSKLSVSPIIESAQSDSDEGSIYDGKKTGSKDEPQPCWKGHENQLSEDFAKTRPSIVNRITKALTSTSCSLGRERTSTSGPFLLKLKPYKQHANDISEDKEREAEGRPRAETPPHTCSFCGKTFLTPSRLARHRVHHLSGKHFCCDVCGKSFVNQEKLDFHHQVHTQSVKGYFTCDQCGQTCRKWRNFVNHMRTHSDNGGKKHSCEICGHTVSSQARLRRHLIHHKKGLHHCCYNCGKLFKTQDDLNWHTAKHGKLSTAAVSLHPVPKPIAVLSYRTADSATVHTTPLTRKHPASEPSHYDQPLVKGHAVSRATGKQVKEAGSENIESQNPEMSENEDGGGLQEEVSTSGIGTPDMDGHSTQSSLTLDSGEVRKSSRKRSHSRKMCSCCPNSMSVTSPSSSHFKNSKSDSSKNQMDMVTVFSSEKKRKEVSDTEVTLEQTEKNRQVIVKESSTEKGSDQKKGETFYGDLTLRECSIKLEQSPKVSPERMLQNTSKQASCQKTHTITEIEEILELTSPDQPSPKAEMTHKSAADRTWKLASDKIKRSPANRTKKSGSDKTQMSASDRTQKSGSDKLKKQDSDLFGGRKVKIYRTASEKMLPKNLALSSASRERARKAAKEKQRQKAAKAENAGEAGSQKKASVVKALSTPSNTKYSCTICRESFRSESDMKIHVSKHLTRTSPRQHVDIESVAQSCRLSYARGSPDKQGYVCHRCGFNAQGYADLTKHMWIHSSKPYQCSECCLAFTFSDTLQRHMKVHKSKTD